MVETELHKKMKQAVKMHLNQGKRCWYESTLTHWGGVGSLRADASYIKNHRHYYVECETKPNIKRIKDKGKRRKKIRERNMYLLMVPDDAYVSRNWDELRGYFDQVIAYDEKFDSISHMRDFRTLGWLQDFILNTYVPLIKNEILRGLVYRFRRFSYRVMMPLRRLIQCTACRHSVPTPWRWCPVGECSK